MDSLTIEDWQLVKVKNTIPKTKLKGRRPNLGEIYVETFAKWRGLLQAYGQFLKGQRVN